MKKRSFVILRRIFLTILLVSLVCLSGWFGMKVGEIRALRNSVMKEVIGDNRGSVLFYYRWEGDDREDIIIDCTGGGGYIRVPWEAPGMKFWLVEMPTWNNCTINREVFYWPRMTYVDDRESKDETE